MKKMILTYTVAVVLFSTCAIAGTWQTFDAPEGSTQLLAVDGSNIIAEISGVNYYLYNGTTWFLLPNIPGYSYMQPYDISGGVIVGSCFGPTSVHGYTYNGSTWTTYDAPLATHTTAINSIDGSNLVGDYWDDVGIHGFFYNGTTWTTLDYPGANHTSVCGISGENLVGGYGSGTGMGCGFLYNYNEMTWTALDFPGAYGTYISDIDGDNIVGSYCGSAVHGFLYNRTTWTTLDFPGACYTQVEGISGNTLVGWYKTDTGFLHSFIYTITKSGIARCTVTAGKTQGQDTFSMSGSVEFPAHLDLNDVNHIDVNIISLTDGASIYAETIDSSVMNGKFKYTHKIPRGGTGAITSLTVDFRRKLFSIKAQKVDLTGLACPLRLQLSLSNDIISSGDADESIVNGKKRLIPTCLMMTYDDVIVVNKAKAKHNSKKLFSDTLSVKGDIAVIDTDVNLCNEDVTFIWGAQMLWFPQGSFKTSKTGHLFKCRKVAADTNGDPGFVTAQVDIDKATFTLLVTGVNDIDAASSSIPFGISFADFDETVNVNRVTGRSW